MEGLTRLVSESLARHGFDRPLDYRRLHWSRWFRCDSHHSLLFVPSKPGVFAVAEEVLDLSRISDHMATAASAVPRSEASGRARGAVSGATNLEDHAFGATTEVEQRRFSAASAGPSIAALATGADPECQKPEAESPRRMLAVTQFFEDDDMAFILDRMLSRQNPMGARLASGRYFVRFVVIQDQTQRRTICSALNQWMVSAAEKASGIGSHFASSLELTPANEYIPHSDGRQQSLFPHKKEDGNVARAPSPATADTTDAPVEQDARIGRTLLSAPADTAHPQAPVSASSITATAPHLNSGAATNIHCPSPFPSGF